MLSAKTLIAKVNGKQTVCPITPPAPANAPRPTALSQITKKHADIRKANISRTRNT